MSRTGVFAVTLFVCQVAKAAASAAPLVITADPGMDTLRLAATVHALGLKPEVGHSQHCSVLHRATVSAHVLLAVTYGLYEVLSHGAFVAVALQPENTVTNVYWMFGC